MIANNCNKSILLGILGGAGQQTPKDGGFLLNSGQEVVVDVPENWSCRMWRRQKCDFNADGKARVPPETVPAYFTAMD